MAIQIIDDSYLPIQTVPRDGSVVIIAHEDVGCFHMKWNPVGYNELAQPEPIGIWEAPGGSLTWSEQGGMGPSHWKPASKENAHG